MARLVITGPNDQVQVFEISGPKVEIGRADTNHLVLDHPSVSRHHTRLEVRSGEPDVLQDLGSLNGTFANDNRITEHRLSDQDRITIGVFQLVYEAAVERALHVESAEPAPEITGIFSTDNLNSMLRADPQPAAKPSGDQRLRELEQENKVLRLLAGAGKVLSTALTPEEAIRRTMELAFRMENVERGFVMLLDAEGKGFKPAVMLYKDESLRTNSRSVALSKSLVSRVMSEKLPLVIHDVESDERFTGSESLRMSGVRSAMCAPLIFEEKLFGLFYVDCLTKPFAFSKEELNIFAVISTEAAMGFQNARAHEELAQRESEHRALERFLSPEVIQKIQTNPERVHLGGENQVATILFSDVRGFTRMSETMEPQQIVALLNEYFTEMTEIIFDHGGTLDKYIGDAIMALFGTPLPRRDDVPRAVKAAIEMQWALKRLNQEWEAAGRKTIQIGIGINTGQVTAGNIGSAKRMDYTVIGDEVNLSSRLCSNAKPGQILVSESTFAAMGRNFGSKKLHPLTVKGKAKPVQVYEILWREYFMPSTATAP